MIQKIKMLFNEQLVFTISLVLAIATSLFKGPDLSSIDFKVILSLFNLMLICLALEKYRLLDKISWSILERFNTARKIAVAMVLTTGFLAMFITNDVALITVVPLTIITAKKSGFDPYKVIALETVAANAGSSLTPFGNPQNLFLYEYFKINNCEFLVTMLPFTLIVIAALLASCFLVESRVLSFKQEHINIENKPRLVLYCTIFALVLLSILRLADYRAAFIVVLAAFALMDRELIRKVDYFLLLTFVCFFVFIGNISDMAAVSSFASSMLNSKSQVITTSLVFSQFISNVPAAILLSGFTGSYRELLLGVNIGGIGTLIASLANLISYKIYRRSYSSKSYTKFFYILNAVLLLLLYIIFVIIKY